MSITIITPINKAALSVACDRAGMSDGAKQVILGYFPTVLKEYASIANQKPEPVPVQEPPAPVATADVASTGVTLA